MSDLATKAKDISTALGISNEPAQLSEAHTGQIDQIHDAIGETKTAMQNKNNYSANTHLSTAQRHLKDAKAVLDTKGLSADTKHVLAKVAVGKASNSLSNATSAAAPADKSTISAHNDNLKSFAANPPTAFAKYNDNHGEGGRFTSIDGTTGVPVNGGHSDSLKASVNAMRDVSRTYADKLSAHRATGQKMTPTMLDTVQAKNDGMAHLANAVTSLQHDTAASAHDSLRSAASALGSNDTFSSHASTVSGIADGLGKKIGKSNDNHDERGRFASGDGGSGGATFTVNSDRGATVLYDSTEQSITDAYKAAFEAQYTPGQPANGDFLDLAQVREDGYGHLESAQENIDSKNYAGASKDLKNAATTFAQEPAFKDHANAFNALSTYYANKVTKFLSFSLAEVDFPTKA